MGVGKNGTPRPARPGWLALRRVAVLTACRAGMRLLCASAALAGSPPFPVGLSVSATAGGGSDEVGVSVRSTVGARCEVRVRAATSSLSLPTRTIGRAGTASWRWAPSGMRSDLPWRFTATCRIGGLWSARWMNEELGFPSAGGALAPSGTASASTPGASCDGQRLCFLNDPFPTGQCTWYAAGRRPDVNGIVHGNAGSWLSEARGHLREGWYPRVGSLAVWLPDHGGADGEGHVAYVAEVSPEGRVLVDDSNWRPTPASPPEEVHEHWISALAPSGYIYGGPAGAGS